MKVIRFSAGKGGAKSLVQVPCTFTADSAHHDKSYLAGIDNREKHCESRSGDVGVLANSQFDPLGGPRR